MLYLICIKRNFISCHHPNIWHLIKTKSFERKPNIWGRCDMIIDWYLAKPCLMLFNSLWPSDVIWWHISGPTLAQEWLVAWQYQVITWANVDFSLVRFCNIHVESRFMSAYAAILYNGFEDYTFKITVISPKDQWVNSPWLKMYHQFSNISRTLVGN